MRVNAGFGLITLIGLVAACSTEIVEVQGVPESPTTKTSPTDPSDSTDPSTPLGALVPGLSISDIAVFQGVKVPIVANGEAVTTKRAAPVVGGRSGIVRVYVKADKTFRSREVTAELRLATDEGAFPIVRVKQRISGSSTEEDADSTFNIEIPAESFPAGVSMQVALTSKDGVPATEGEPNASRWPQDGSWQDLRAIDTAVLKVVLVPVKYTFDGSDRLPTLTDEQIELYKNTLMGRYPTSKVDFKVREPFEYAEKISGQEPKTFEDLLGAIRDLRGADGVDDDVYYYGSLMTATSFEKFCISGCVAGLSALVSDYRASFLRASIGVGFPGQQAADTMAHEIGHAHGRAHAPCGPNGRLPQGIDSNFPDTGLYENGGLGVWGYDIGSKAFHSPEEGHDMMSYCDNEWVSDYTFNALAKRLNDIKKMASTSEDEDFVVPETQAYTIARVDSDGDTVVERETSVRHALTGGVMKQLAIRDQVGMVQTTNARFFPYDHTAGGVLYIPRVSSERWKDIALNAAGGGFKSIRRVAKRQ